MRVLVTQPGLQHAHQLAWALEEAGHLAAFWSGVPVEDASQRMTWSRRLLPARLRAVPIARERRRHDVAFAMIRRAISKQPSRRLGRLYGHYIDYLYDAWVAQTVRRLKPDLAVCYENAALRTFRAARSVGALCVLDAASVHYTAQREWRADRRDADPRSVEERKELEIATADAILTCSRLAAQTYTDAGVPSVKVFTIPLGTALSTTAAASRAPGGTCRFLFVGSVVQHKGVDSLLEVFEEFAARQTSAQLTVIGGVAEQRLERRLRGLPNVVRMPFLPQTELFEEVARHDCLVLPSWFDAFGMVVPEAMAVGVPAIVSDRVGSKCIIEDHPGAGWIVPCDTQALKAQMLALVNNRDLLGRASVTARRAAREYSWENYRARVVRTLESVFASHRSPGQARTGTPI